MLNLRFWLASDIGNVISIIGIIIALISFFVGNKKKDKHIIIFVTLITITAVVLLFVNKIDIKNNYFRIPDVHELTVDSAKFMLIDNGINIDNVIFHSISSNSLSEGVTNVIGVDPTSGEIVNTASVINIFYEEGIHNETEADMINSSNIDPPEELMIAINEQLSDEGKEMDKEDLRAFICMLNGDYEFINQDSFCRTLNTFTNIDGTIPNIFGGIDIADDHMSSISAISGAFFREKDSMFVEYWITRFEELKEKIFLQEDMEFIYQEIDEFSVDFYLTFCCNNPIQVNNEIISINALRGETVFFVQEFISHNIVLYLVSIYGENSQQNLEMEDPVTGEIVMIPVNLMCDELLESTNYTLSVIANKINKP